MNKEIKDRWVQLLESGEYKFGRDKMYNYDEDSYCPLGVLVEVALEQGVEVSIKLDTPKFSLERCAFINDNPHYLPENLRSWAGMTYAETKEVARKNDTGGVNSSIKFIKESL